MCSLHDSLKMMRALLLANYIASRRHAHLLYMNNDSKVQRPLTYLQKQRTISCLNLIPCKSKINYISSPQPLEFNARYMLYLHGTVTYQHSLTRRICEGHGIVTGKTLWILDLVAQVQGHLLRPVAASADDNALDITELLILIVTTQY